MMVDAVGAGRLEGHDLPIGGPDCGRQDARPQEEGLSLLHLPEAVSTISDGILLRLLLRLLLKLVGQLFYG